MMRFISAAEMQELLSPRAAGLAIEVALRAGIDPSDDAARMVIPVPSGQLLVMPAATVAGVGGKIITVAPDNPAAGRPRVQGLYVLFAADGLGVRAVLDGAALTTLRTPAVSAAFVGLVRERFVEAPRVVIFGAGPQALAHVTAVEALGLGSGSFTIVARRPAEVVLPDVEGRISVVLATDQHAPSALAHADLVICATTARTPLFDSAALKSSATVVAIGSHEVDVRELDSALMTRATVVVEDVDTALREAGDVFIAIHERALDASALVGLAELATGRVTVPADRPVVFKSVGMAWEDLVVAVAVAAAAEGEAEPVSS